VARFTFFNVPSVGHVNPMQAVIAELVRRGHDVTYYNTEELRQKVLATGAQFRPYVDIEELRYLDDRVTPILAENALMLLHIAEELLPWIMADLRAEQPDVILHDSLAGWGKQAAEALNTPAASLLTTFAINPRVMMSMPLKSMIRTMRDVALRMPRYTQIARKLRHSVGVRSYGLAGALMNTNALNIVFTSREFQPAGSTFNSSYKFVGPSMADRADDPDFPFEQLNTKPLIYISLGTINNRNIEFYRACLSSFTDHPGQFVMSVGQRVDLKSLEPIPANFLVRNLVPQLEVLQRADLFITHGGMNSVHEGLWYGVPLVVIPQQVEQFIVAAQVVKHGAGVILNQPGAAIDPRELYRTIEHVVNRLPDYKAAAEQLGESFHEAGGYLRAVDELVAFAEVGRTRVTRI
jgi:MGT family glycosyltransferase